MQLINFAILVTSFNWTMALVSGGCFFFNAKMLPKNPVFRRDANITLTCIINTSCYTGPVNASNLGFRINTTNYPPEHPYVTYISKTTTELTVPHANFSSGGNYQCILFEDGVIQNKTFGEVDYPVQVGIPPPTITSNSLDCLVDNWSEMICSVDHGQPTHLYTTYIWSFVIKGGYAVDECHCKNMLTCILSKTDSNCRFFELQIYGIKVVASNALGSSDPVNYIPIDPTKIVKPAPVTNIKIQAITSTSVMIAFDVDQYMKPQIFRIFYKSKFDDTWQHIEINNKDYEVNKPRTVTINALIPFAEYSYTITAIPSFYAGFWSENATAHGQQPSDVPWAAPVFAPGSFQRSDCKNNCPSFCGDNCAEVTIFWPKVEERYRNGNIIAYEIEGKEIPKYNSDISMLKKLYLNNNRSYTFSLRAENTKGFSPNRSTIYIPRKTEAPSAPVYVAAIKLNSSTALVKWKQTEGNGQQLPTTYTVFWCKGNGQCEADSDLYSEIVPANFSSILVNINTADGNTVSDSWFSVSANKDHGHSSSGMISSECVYRPDNVLSPPDLRKSLLDQEYVIAVDWSAINCDKKNDTIIYFEIWFCEVQPETNDICQAGTEKKENASSNETQHVITNDVKADSLYLVWAVSVTSTSKSAESQKIKIKTSGLSSVEIAGIAIGSVFGALMVCCGVFSLVRKWGKEIHRFCANKYPINMPGNDDRDEALRHFNSIDTLHSSVDSTQSISGLQVVSAVCNNNRNEKKQQKLEGRDKTSNISEEGVTLQEYAQFGVNNVRPNISNGDLTALNGVLPSHYITMEMALSDSNNESHNSTSCVNSSADAAEDEYRIARIQSDSTLETATDSENEDSGSVAWLSRRRDDDDKLQKLGYVTRI